MPRQYWAEGLTWEVADGTAVANTVSETILFPNVTIPANFMQDGRVFRITANGKYSTTATPTMIFSLRWGGVAGTLLTKSFAITTPTTVTNAVWDVEILVQTRTNGATGTIMAIGTARVYAAVAPTVGSATGAPGVSAMTTAGGITPSAVTCDLTADTAMALTLTWSAASASNTATGLERLLLSAN